MINPERAVVVMIIMSRPTRGVVEVPPVRREATRETFPLPHVFVKVTLASTSGEA